MLRTLFGKNQGTRFPEAAYSLAEGERDGLPVIAMINAAYKGYSFRSDYPWHLEITIEMSDVNDLGLPSNQEAPVLNAFEDELEAEIRKTGAVHHIARQTWNRVRVLDYYIEDAALAQRVLATIGDGNPVRQFTSKIVRDEAWEKCGGLLVDAPVRAIHH